MMNRPRRTLGTLAALFLVAALGAWSCDQAGNGDRAPAGPSLAGAGSASGSSAATAPAIGAPAGAAKMPPPDGATVLAMTEALQDEYHAEWAYQDVLDAFGNVKPFSSIHQAELKHIDAVTKLFTKRGLTAPPSEWLDDAPLVFSSVTAACEEGIAAEQANIAMYVRLLGGDLPDDVEKVFTKLMEASRDSHLPAFENCVSKAK